MQISQKPRTFCANNCGRQLPKQYVYYCSNACKTDAYRTWIIGEWNAGKLKSSTFFNRVLRRHLLELFGEQCQRCGWSEVNPASGKVPIEVEHIDGDWKNIRPDNLTLLCPNCHSLTKTFRGLNRGRGRPGRPGTVSSGERVRIFLQYPLRPVVADEHALFAGSLLSAADNEQASALFEGSVPR
jgi:hypothetical protein